MSPLRALLAAGGSGWHYAAWVSVDVRLLVFVLLIAALIGAGVAAILVKSRRTHDYLSVFVLAFVGTLALLLLVFNEIAQHPVFVVESFFPFP